MSMADIGEKLKAAREKRSLTIEQVQKQTLIHAPVLAALEEGRCDEILTPTYVKGFLKKYAGYLGLDYKEILNEYASLHADKVSGGVNPDKAVKPKKNDGKDTTVLLRRVMLAVIALALIALFVFLAYASVRFLYSLSKRPHKTAKVSLKAKVSETRPAAARKNAAKSSRSAKTVVPKNEPLNITIKVRSPVWVELKKDGEKQFQRVLPRGLAESVTAREKVELFIANGDVVEIFLNGRSLGSPGKGVIKDLEITRNGMKVK